MSCGRARSLLVPIAAAMALAGATQCGDDEPECADACTDLAFCEDEWLVAAGEPEMDGVTRNQYIDDCVEECESQENPQLNIDCIYEASCDELADGKCR